MFLERGFVCPSRVDIEQTRIPHGPEHMDVKAARLFSRWLKNLSQRFLDVPPRLLLAASLLWPRVLPLPYESRNAVETSQFTLPQTGRAVGGGPQSSWHDSRIAQRHLCDPLFVKRRHSCA